MDILWKIGAADVARVRELIGQQRENALVCVRRSRNLAKFKPPVRRKRFWKQMVCMRLTTQQLSGPNGHVARFVRTKPFPLSYEAVCMARDVERFIGRALRKSGGIRFGDKIAEELAWNFHRLQDGEWDRAIKQCNRLMRRVPRGVEKEVAEYIQDTFMGFGPKQSRNVLQALYLTRYEIPIDSRVTDWLNEFGFPVRLSAGALGDSNYYNFVSDGIQILCAKCKVFPCILDAAIFALKDGDGWTPRNLY